MIITSDFHNGPNHFIQQHRRGYVSFMIDFHINLIGRIKLQQTGDVHIQTVFSKKARNGARSVVIYTRKKHCHPADEWQMYFSDG